MEMNILVCVCVCVCVCVSMVHTSASIYPLMIFYLVLITLTPFCCQNPSHGPLDVLFWFYPLRSLQSLQRRVGKAMVVFLF